jgi:hypothetical protein
LVLPKQLADAPDLRIGPTELIVADVINHQTVWTDRGPGVAEQAGLPCVQSRPGGVQPYAVRSAITQELPRRQLVGMVRIIEIHDVQEAANPSVVP